MNPPNKINSLTSLRAFAAAGLLYFHQMRPVIGIDPNEAFALGVSFFFVLSGFILTINYPNLGRKDVGRFFLARFARLYPVHIFTLILFGLLFSPAVLFDPDLRVPLNGALVQAWVPVRAYIFSMNSVSWSVSAELFFYLCFPFIIWANRPGMIFAALLFATVIAILGVDHFFNSSVGVEPWDFSPGEMIVNTPYFRVAEFAAGVWCATLFRSGFLRSTISRAPNVAEVLAVAAVIAYGVYGPTVGGWFMSEGNVLFGLWVQVSGGMLIFGLLLIVMANQSGVIGKLLQTRPMVFLGETSFALYMIHSIVINAVVLNNLLPDQHWTVRATLVTTSAYLLSFLLWWAVETPCRRLILRATKKPPAVVTASI